MAAAHQPAGEPSRRQRVSVKLSPQELGEHARRCQRERQQPDTRGPVRAPIKPLQPLPFVQRPLEYKKDIRGVQEFVLPVYYEPWWAQRLRPRGGFEDPQQPGVWFFGSPDVKPAKDELRLIQVRDSVGTVWVVWSRSNYV